MASIARELRASYAFAERNINLVKRYWGWEIVWLIYSIAHSLAIGFIGMGMEQISGQRVDTSQLVLYLLVGTLVWSYLAVVFDAVGEMIAWERWEGTIEYTFMAPVSRLTHMVGTCVFAVVYGLLRTALILGIIGLSFHLDLSRADLLAAATVLAVASLSFIGLGIMVATLPLLYTERGSQMVYIAQACLLLFSGVYYPVDVMPEWMQVVAQFSPATYALLAVRGSLIDGRGVVELAGHILPLLAMGLVSIPLGVRIFVAAERYAKRTGRLKRSG
ncbi:MAG: ABC transporter permease [Chloroflexi bacterium]|nr:ABC transporter permease [Chloroflexota bacterium]